MGVSSLEELPTLPEVSGSDAVRQLQEKVDMLRAADKDQMVMEMSEQAKKEETTLLT